MFYVEDTSRKVRSYGILNTHKLLTYQKWNFCRWIADVPPRETSPAAKSEEERIFRRLKQYLIIVN